MKCPNCNRIMEEGRFNLHNGDGGAKVIYSPKGMKSTFWKGIFWRPRKEQVIVMYSGWFDYKKELFCHHCTRCGMMILPSAGHIIPPEEL